MFFGGIRRSIPSYAQGFGGLSFSHSSTAKSRGLLRRRIKIFKVKTVMNKFKKDQNNSSSSSTQTSLSERKAPRLPGLKAQLVFWPLIAAGFTLDLWSKIVVFDWLKQQQSNSVSIIDGFLQLVLAQNDGAAFGLFSGKPYLLAAVSVIALLVILAIFFLSGTQHTLVHIALALFAAGVCGNLYDRIFNNGFVRDFIDVYYRQFHWPAFNIADTMLCIGVGVLILSTFFTGKPYRTHARQHKLGRLTPPPEQ